jgi:hypothetical protein
MRVLTERKPASFHFDDCRDALEREKEAQCTLLTKLAMKLDIEIGRRFG